MNEPVNDAMAAFNRHDYDEVIRLMEAQPASQEISSPQLAELFWVTAHSLYMKSRYRDSISFSTKVAFYMIEKGDTVKGKDLFEGMLQMTVSSLVKLKRNYEALQFLRNVENEIGKPLPALNTLREGLIKEFSQLLYRRTTTVVLVTSVLIGLLVELPGFTNVYSVALIIIAFLAALIVVFAKQTVTRLILSLLSRV